MMLSSGGKKVLDAYITLGDAAANSVLESARITGAIVLNDKWRQGLRTTGKILLVVAVIAYFLTVLDDLNSISSSLESIESDVSSLQSDVSQIQTDVSTIQDNVNSIQTNTDEIEGNTAR